MSDDPFAINPLFSAWLDSQSRFLEAHAPFWSQISSTAEGDNDASTADEIWSSARKMGEAWLQTNFADGKGLAQQTLQRMLDPNQFLYAGSDEIGRTMQKLVEAPEFSDIGTLERQGLHATREWIALREASTEYRVVTGKAWTRAFERFSRELVDAPGKVQDGPNAIMRLWLDIANDELIATQRTNDFLSAQRKLLRAAVELRLRVRELVERWCESNSIPTRTEVDDLHAYVHQLRRDMRDLKRSLRAPTSATSDGAKSRAFQVPDND